MKRRKQVNPVWLLSVEEVALQNHFHPNTVRAWVNQDNLRHYRKGRGGKIYIREDDVRDFIARNYDIGGML
jgi:excisionase family DNA binding protein